MPASVPIGLYAVHPVGALHVNNLLVVIPPEPLATFLDERRYLPKGVPLLKHVLALPGQTVCRSTARSPSMTSRRAKRSIAIIWASRCPSTAAVASSPEAMSYS
jgi:type IV secretory pathway protease TraF